MWKDILNYEGHYKINTEGQVKSIKKSQKTGNVKDELILSPKIDAYGYNEVGLRKNGVVKYMKVHRIVALTFIDNPDNKPQVNHKDANKLNNNLYNLEWATSQEDANHRLLNNLQPKGKRHYAYGVFGAKSKSAKIVVNTQNGIFYDCVNEAAYTYGIKYKTLVGMLSGGDKNWTNLIYA